MDIVRKRGVKGGQGNAVSEYSDIIGRAGSWQYGNDARVNDVEDEKREEDLAFGTPNDVSPSSEQNHDPSGLDKVVEHE